MKLEFIEVGRIVNAHGIRGDVKIHPVDCDPELIARCKTIYINGSPYRPSQSRVHKGCVLAHLPGVEDMDAALALKGQPVSLRRQDAHLPDGVYFAAELVGLEALDSDTGHPLGRLEQVLPYPAHDVYRIVGKGTDFLVPAVPAFIRDIDLEGGTIRIQMMEGLL